ncbi:MAG: hypothetical protein COV36_05400 [Alphaproteobacteria bacterium CG11_big_fil_rev_8_21_14_0_20_44_7]|nr:MAG: hypothetical protein COV36_05400 [Alphaproteobacteria bacterium CG11_big_fil_rev_8_21_14_0_20_44_7]
MPQKSSQTRKKQLIVKIANDNIKKMFRHNICRVESNLPKLVPLLNGEVDLLERYFPDLIINNVANDSKKEAND